MSSPTTAPLRVAILGSGQGSIAEAVLAHQASRESCPYRVVAVISSAQGAGIVAVGQKYHIATYVLSSADPAVMEAEILAVVQDVGVQMLVLAGFLRLLPAAVINAMHGRVINTHPALLPKYGGKGMYGRRVHEAVVRANEVETGVTIHWVTELYDEGAVIAQRTVGLKPTDSVEIVEQKVKSLEKVLLPITIEQLAEGVS